MFRKSLFTLVLIGAAACGDDSTDDDVAGDGGSLRDASSDSSTRDGSVDSSAGDASTGLLQEGNYALSNIDKVSDDCGLALEDGTQPPIPLKNTGTMISLGTFYTSASTPAWNPPGYALGSGPYATATTANLTATATITDGNCTYDVVRTTNVEYTANNTLEIEYVDLESNQSSGCGALGYPTSNCRSEYTFTLTKVP